MKKCLENAKKLPSEASEAAKHRISQWNLSDILRFVPFQARHFKTAASCLWGWYPMQGLRGRGQVAFALLRWWPVHWRRRGQTLIQRQRIKAPSSTGSTLKFQFSRGGIWPSPTRVCMTPAAPCLNMSNLQTLGPFPSSPCHHHHPLLHPNHHSSVPFSLVI